MIVIKYNDFGTRPIQSRCRLEDLKAPTKKQPSNVCLQLIQNLLLQTTDTATEGYNVLQALK